MSLSQFLAFILGIASILIGVFVIMRPKSFWEFERFFMHPKHKPNKPTHHYFNLCKLTGFLAILFGIILIVTNF